MLARELGMTVGELLDRMSSSELAEWATLYRIEADEQQREASKRR